jgi:hypothetical protein
MPTAVLSRPKKKAPAATDKPEPKAKPIKPTPRPETTVKITHVRLSPTKSNRWKVTDDETGEVMLTSARDPEFEVCRLLIERGVTGTLRTYVGDSVYHSLTIGIERGAGMTTMDAPSAGPVVKKWHPVVIGEADEAD